MVFFHFNLIELLGLWASLKDVVVIQSGLNPFRVVVLQSNMQLLSEIVSQFANQPALILVASFESALQTLLYLKKQPCDILLTCLELTDVPAFELMQKAKRLNPSCEVVVLAESCSDEEISLSFQSGATGYFYLPDGTSHLVSRLPCVKQGGALLSGSVARRVLKIVGNSDSVQRPHSNLAKLTKREQEILFLLSKGCVSSEIAAQLGIKKGTVANYIKSLYRKLQATSGTQAIAAARKQGLI